MVPFIAGTLVSGVNEDGTFEIYSVYPDGAITEIEDYLKVEYFVDFDECDEYGFVLTDYFVT